MQRMLENFNYPVQLSKQEEGGYLVVFPDFPEAITQGENMEDALLEAADCLEEAVANRVEMNLDIPEPFKPKKNQYMISLRTMVDFN